MFGIQQADDAGFPPMLSITVLFNQCDVKKSISALQHCSP